VGQMRAKTIGITREIKEMYIESGERRGEEY
jgi:hypothetical protein